MRTIWTFALMSLLVSCSEASPPMARTPERNLKLAGCPVLPGVTSVRISGRRGVDYWLCTASYVKSGRTLFDIYVGEHPPEVLSLRYGAITGHGGRNLVWFNSRSDQPGVTRTWHTYLPTTSPRGTVMVVTLTTRAPGELQRIAPLIAHLKQGEYPESAWMSTPGR